MKSTITIGTRGSDLALWQANYVKAQLEALGVEVTLKIIKTKGDQIQHLSFNKIEGKGFFTKEIEDALLRGDIDMAVHSMKDLPTVSPEGLILTAVSYRENPTDTLIIAPNCTDDSLPLRLKKGARVGTSSARRKAQLLSMRPDLEMVDIRGNVPTRLGKLMTSQFDAIVLASAGIERLELDLSAFPVVELNPKEFVPAPAQGVLAYQTNEMDYDTRRLLKKIHNSEVSRSTNIERKALNLMNGGCQMPFGIYCKQDTEGNYHVWAAKAESWNSPVVRVNISSSTSYGLAERVVEELERKKKEVYRDIKIKMAA
jgi:hydroxymethylbilane synthase